MSTTHPRENAHTEFTIDRNWYGDDWRVDDDGYLHTGSGTAHVDRVTITYDSDTQPRP